ncbi:nucleotidyl-sugar pyranose mutase [Mucilaginibacter limnophilus]|uniref:Nucleotidyl-sugar pyranose mutase n=1 Tax=Mucilaginibacter limnophilus TaxID=1932778 RepID=A0A3S2UPR7_9SPHI|nr:NAD(P)-binding protein [Mucilaginibacter limnophilus]RVU03014.1 nucleotidyl-sugar pyranose mutase [Mucilaginibacter limnophilus]
MKIGVLGAGISGLSIARLLSKQYDVELLEREAIHGGIARTRDAQGISYHVTGGHCFNTKYPDVLDFVFKEILPEHQWHKIQRRATIKFDNTEVTYPIEYAVKQINEFDNDLAIAITKDFLASEDDNNYRNLEDWFRKKFGNTLADLYFIPYNTKIWNCKPADMCVDWVEGKLPIPDKKSFFKGLVSNENDNMPHSTFYYPNTNNQNTFIDNLAKGLKITTNYNIKSIVKNTTGQWIVNDDKRYDLIISTLPLNVLPSLIHGTNEEILNEAGKLKYNKVTTMLWETTGTQNTWTYIPEADNFFHRYIHIGNFFRPAANYSITEVVGEKTYDEMLQNGKKDPFLIRPVDYHVSDHAYVVFDENYTASTSAIKNYLNNLGIYTLGRFGEWQYYNMDVCIKSSIDLAATIEKEYSFALAM